MSGNAVQQSQKFNNIHRIYANERIEHGYMDGGRTLQFNDDSSIKGKPLREIILVKDPAEDPFLKEAIDNAKREMFGMKTMREKAEFLNQYTANLLRIKNDESNMQVLDKISGDFKDASIGTKIPLGKLIEFETGVCRHLSLLFKVLGDETGVPVALVRGRYYRNSNGVLKGGPHAWNEVINDDGQRIVVDVMHNFVGDMNNPKVQNYYDVTIKKKDCLQNPDEGRLYDKAVVGDEFILNKNWQGGVTKNFEPIFRMPTKGLLGGRISQIMDKLTYAGLKPKIYTSKKLGETIRLSGPDVEKFQKMQKAGSLQNGTPFYDEDITPLCEL